MSRDRPSAEDKAHTQDRGKVCSGTVPYGVISTSPTGISRAYSTTGIGRAYISTNTGTDTRTSTSVSTGSVSNGSGSSSCVSTSSRT